MLNALKTSTFEQLREANAHKMESRTQEIIITQRRVEVDHENEKPITPWVKTVKLQLNDEFIV